MKKFMGRIFLSSELLGGFSELLTGLFYVHGQFVYLFHVFFYGGWSYVCESPSKNNLNFYR